MTKFLRTRSLFQINNYGKKKNAKWNQHTVKHSIMLQARGSSGYKYLRTNMFHLPCRQTLRAYTGKITGQVGVTPSVEKRLKMEKENLKDDRLLLGNLEVDEMSIAKSKKYKRILGRKFGRCDMGGIVKASKQLANKMLAFVFCGLQIPYKIPVAYFLVNKLTGEQQYKLTVHVIKKIEEIGFKVHTLCADNASTNRKMFALFNPSGKMWPVVPHPVQPEDMEEEENPEMKSYRPLFLLFDPVHIIKNVRNLLQSRTFLIEGKNVFNFYFNVLKFLI